MPGGIYTRERLPAAGTALRWSSYQLGAAGLHIGDLRRGGRQGGPAVEEVEGVGAGSHLLLVDGVGGFHADVARDLSGQRLGGRWVGGAAERVAGVEAQLAALRDGKGPGRLHGAGGGGGEGDVVALVARERDDGDGYLADSGRGGGRRWCRRGWLGRGCGHGCRAGRGAATGAAIERRDRAADAEGGQDAHQAPHAGLGEGPAHVGVGVVAG